MRLGRRETLGWAEPLRSPRDPANYSLSPDRGMAINLVTGANEVEHHTLGGSAMPYGDDPYIRVEE
jgi:hypothetical protein